MLLLLLAELAAPLCHSFFPFALLCVCACVRDFFPVCFVGVVAVVAVRSNTKSFSKLISARKYLLKTQNQGWTKWEFLIHLVNRNDAVGIVGDIVDEHANMIRQAEKKIFGGQNSQQTE